MYLLKQIRKNQNVSNATIFELLYNTNSQPITVTMIQPIEEATQNDINYIKRRVERNKDILEYTNKLMIDFLNECDNLNECYTEFKIPKRSGGYRTLHAPDQTLKSLQKMIYNVLINCNVLSTQWSFAYQHNKSCIDLAKVHKESNYFVKVDLHNFFDSIDREILENKLKEHFTMYYIEETVPGFINNLINISLLDNRLPQGSPLSPILSNIVMIDFDYTVKNTPELKSLLYSRYADDLVFSSKSYVSKKIIVDKLKELLLVRYYDKIKLNYNKIKFLTKNQRCYLVGVKINKDNELTFGHEKKKKLKLDLYNLFKAKEYGTLEIQEAREVLGLFNYMAQIEPNYAKFLEHKLMNQFGVNSKTIYKYFLGS